MHKILADWGFLSTLSLRRATVDLGQNRGNVRISIHALLAESDVLGLGHSFRHNTFLSTLSLRRATTWARGSRVTYVEFLSTLSLRRATCIREDVSYSIIAFLSTLSLRRATLTLTVRNVPIDISIHALLAESDRAENHANSQKEKFLSTLSLRRATKICFLFRRPKKFLSTLSLRRATIPNSGTLRNTHISIHALLAESDQGRSGQNIKRRHISIHALLAESDETSSR